ncbi:shikimate kinase [Bacilliculturomica massiliensis]|uniref:shikimate kinase n=1 Tax=Bacilliculturomica massiliensis TaxID=1917867 RepID=UPI0010309E63|nr:shikimate kinase [Bacilliculturomica massiliensis]
MNRENIVMIGMPACGKSTVGVILAKSTGKSFMDTDLLIQEREGDLLQNIIDGRGNDYFQKIEEEVLAGVTAAGAVISTGGSAVYYDKAMKHLGETGKIVYLALPLSEIVARLDNISTRGITMAPGETIADLYEKRVPLYEKYADLKIETLGLTVEQTVERIIAGLEELCFV